MENDSVICKWNKYTIKQEYRIVETISQSNHTDWSATGNTVQFCKDYSFDSATGKFSINNLYTFKNGCDNLPCPNTLGGATQPMSNLSLIYIRSLHYSFGGWSVAEQSGKSKTLTSALYVGPGDFVEIVYGFKGYYPDNGVYDGFYYVLQNS